MTCLGTSPKRPGLWFALLFVALIGATLTSGCRSRVDDRYLKLAQNSFSNAPTLRLGYRDVIQLEVFPETELNQVATISPEGTISFPLIGDVQVAGLSCHGVERKLTKLLKEGYLRDPSVNCSIDEMHSQKVTVTGAVGTQGTVPYREDLTVLDVYAEVGGTATAAASDRVKLVRILDGKQKEYMIPLRQITRGRAPNLLMWPGDLLYVPTAGLLD